MRQFHPFPASAFALFAVLATFGLARAATAAVEVCVSDSVTLQAQLVLVQVIAQPRTIQLVRSATAYVIGGQTDVSSVQTLSIEGGYNANCTSRIVDPANTVIDLGGVAARFATGTGPGLGLAIDGLTIRHGGLTVQPYQYDPGADLAITRTRLTGLSSFEIDGGQGMVQVENSLIDHLAAQPDSPCSATFLATRATHFILVHDTIDLGSGDNLCLEASTIDGVIFDVYNSIVWGSDGSQGGLLTGNLDSSDPHPPFVTLRNNILHGISGPGSISNTGAMNIDPKWIAPSGGNYRLTTGASPSPAIDQGFLVVPLGMPSTDIAGAQRVQGGFPDLGAYESTPAVPATIVVTNTNDSGSGSLRAAIIAANSDPDANDITFAIPGACPRTIALSTTLPDITTSINFLGGSQPGWVANSSTTGFNATLCVLIKPASGTLGTALRVPATATNVNLYVGHIGFGGFGQPLLLLGGTNTIVLGSQFGGTAGGVTLPGAGLYAINVGAPNAAGSLVVGGSDAGARNLIGGAQQAGINIQSTVQSDVVHCQIAGNLIGMNRDGNTPLPNFTGVLLGGSGCEVEFNRIVGNTRDAITINGAGGNNVALNTIGIGANGSGVFNSGAGVRITAGDNNAIFANTIRFMVAGGVLVTGSAGDGNAIVSNAIYDNGATSDGMDIDIGGLGPTANDPADIDAGPNQLQNFPVVTSVQVTSARHGDGTQGSPPAVTAVLTATLNGVPDAGPYFIQAYFSSSCSPNGRGHAEQAIGMTTMSVTQVNVDTAFSVDIQLPDVAAGHVVSLTATSPQNSTSELGSCFDLAAVTTDSIFADGFESVNTGP